jgi:hypothetical protein
MSPRPTRPRLPGLLTPRRRAPIGPVGVCATASRERRRLRRRVDGARYGRGRGPWRRPGERARETLGNRPLRASRTGSPRVSLCTKERVPQRSTANDDQGASDGCRGGRCASQTRHPARPATESQLPVTGQYRSGCYQLATSRGSHWDHDAHGSSVRCTRNPRNWAELSRSAANRREAST